MFLVVDGMSFSVRPRECYCVVGPNGAGKSTLFRALVGLLPLRKGMASILGFDLARSLTNPKVRIELLSWETFFKAHSEIQQQVTSQLGYCPQFDALPDRLTVVECFYFYARIRAIPRKKIPIVVHAAILLLSLERHAFKQIRHLR